MPLVSYPSKLPVPRHTDYSITLGSGVARTDMERGTARQRLETRSAPNQVGVSFEFTQEQFGAFEAWFAYKINQGADWFNTTLANGAGLQTTEARFVGGTYKVAMQGGLNYTVSATLETRTTPMWTEAAFDTWNT